MDPETTDSPSLDDDAAAAPWVTSRRDSSISYAAFGGWDRVEGSDDRRTPPPSAEERRPSSRKGRCRVVAWWGYFVYGPFEPNHKRAYSF
ncbi:hypothetical protein ABZP36_025773 [Zizania latifolia]